MEFRTKIEIPGSGLLVSHKSRILMFGSCFIENIGNLLVENKFNANLNPFGILYNPQSISQALRLLVENKKFTESDIFEYKGLFHSFYHHSRFSNTDKDKCIEKINGGIERSSADLRQANVLFVTFGTACVFRSKKYGIIAGNCHKLPASDFDRYRLSVYDIVNDWESLIKELKQINPALRIIFTVSPVRHLKDGAHENQLGKSVLLLSVDELRQKDAGLCYFPAYEIVLDELRDYRFYKDDMVHPDTMAIKYIWKRFSETYFDADTCSIIEEWNKIYPAINHRPFNADTDEHKHFLRQTLLKIKAFNEKYPYICCSGETSDLERRL
ncbi:MAG: GSCFA domain-containing protein [Prevotella sp.]|jgi:hypothetical protein|nr:GSCFA domain-containing protein [Prevotella sp.]